MGRIHRLTMLTVFTHNYDLSLLSPLIFLGSVLWFLLAENDTPLIRFTPVYLMLSSAIANNIKKSSFFSVYCWCIEIQLPLKYLPCIKDSWWIDNNCNNLQILKKDILHTQSCHLGMKTAFLSSLCCFILFALLVPARTCSGWFEVKMAVTLSCWSYGKSKHYFTVEYDVNYRVFVDILYL